MTNIQSLIHKVIYLDNVSSYMSTKEAKVKINENIAVNKPEFNEKNTTKFNKDYNNFNERVQ